MTLPLFNLQASWATFGPELDANGYALYRYTLGRSWAVGPRILWVMLNPSTATAEVLDPTIRRCMGFSQAWGYGSLEVVNLFALRSTDPAALKTHADPVGGWRNQHEIGVAAKAAEVVVCAWGAHPAAAGEPADDALAAINGPVHCLGTTKSGAPRHPLYVRADQPLVEWKP